MEQNSVVSGGNDKSHNLTPESDIPSGNGQTIDQPEGKQPAPGGSKGVEDGQAELRSLPQPENRSDEPDNVWTRIKKTPNSIKIYYLLGTVIPLIISYIFYARDIYSIIRPLPPMSGEFNVAIAPFTLLDANGKESSSQDGKKIAEFVHQRLETGLSDLPGLVDVELRGPDKTKEVRGATAEERDRAAEELAAKVNAHILIYGTIQSGENPELHPEFYVNYRGFEQADEIRGVHRLGNPLLVILPFDETKIQDVENPALSARINALSLMVIGLAYDSIDKFDQAITYFGEAEAINGWMDNAGKDVLYLLLGNTLLRKVSVEKDPSYLPDAEEAYDNALAINPVYPRALMGKGGVAYLSALGDPYQDTVDSVDINELREAEGYFKSVLEEEITTDNLNIAPKAHFNLGQIYLVRAQVQDPVWQKSAEGEFSKVIEAFEAGNESIQEMAAQAYARMALINRLQGRPEAAIDTYKKAISLSSPFYQAYYNSRIAEVYAEQGLVDEAIAALEEASKISEFYGDPDSVESYLKRINELRGQSP